MKKNKIMRIASAVLVMVLITTCAISGTFAKYTTSNSGGDSATVAKWGVQITVNGNLFAKEYNADDTATLGAEAKSVKAEGTADIIAPGTSGTVAGVVISGKPEVAVNVKYVATVDLGDNWTGADGKFYCPLKIQIGSTTLKGTDTTTDPDDPANLIPVYANVEAFEAAIKNAIESNSGNYAPNTDLAKTVNISWEWEFTGNNDDNDTFLANKTARPTVSIGLTVTATQIN